MDDDDDESDAEPSRIGQTLNRDDSNDDREETTPEPQRESSKTESGPKRKEPIRDSKSFVSIKLAPSQGQKQLIHDVSSIRTSIIDAVKSAAWSAVDAYVKALQPLTVNDGQFDLVEILKTTAIQKALIKLSKSEKAPEGTKRLCSQLVEQLKQLVNSSSETSEAPSHPPADPNDKRGTTRDKLQIALETDGRFDGSMEIAIRIEKEMHATFPSEKDYLNKARSLIYNVKDKLNHTLRTRIISGEITADKLVRMSTTELANPSITAEREKWKMNEEAKRKTEPTSSGIKCTRCRKDRVNVTQRQVRGADEPMTCFFDCPDCNNTWTDGGQ
eukprot:c20114_g1_i6.p2 GENE.c20114_g1_i6~~c20114_g1_i6.p2  ORF type:complete len:330 (+),score=75.71 c20114_g1_i6:1334-2323(+)